MERFETLGAFVAWLKEPRPPWVGGFDLPFGLPRELVQAMGAALQLRQGQGAGRTPGRRRPSLEGHLCS